MTFKGINLESEYEEKNVSNIISKRETKKNVCFQIGVRKKVKEIWKKTISFMDAKRHRRRLSKLNWNWHGTYVQGFLANKENLLKSFCLILEHKIDIKKDSEYLKKYVELSDKIMTWITEKEYSDFLNWKKKI